MGKNTKIWRKIIFRTILALLLLVVVPPVLLTIPWVQNQVKDQLVNFAEKKTGTEIEIGWVELVWFLDLQINDIVLKDDSSRNMLTVDRLRLDVNTLNLTRRELDVRLLSLDKPGLNLIRDEGNDVTNLSALLARLSVEDTTAGEPWSFSLQALKIDNGWFVFEDQEYPEITEGIDFNHVDMDSVHIYLSSFQSHGDTNLFSIDHLAFAESSGFVIDSFSAGMRMSNTELDATRMSVRTPATSLEMDVNFSFSDWSAFNQFIDSVYMSAEIRPSNLMMSDIGYFAPELRSMTNLIDLRGTVRGLVSSLKARDLEIGYGSGTRILTSMDMAGLPDIMETFVDARFERMSVMTADLERFALPGERFIGPLPDIISRLGSVSTKGVFTGFYNDFVAEATLSSPFGKVRTDLILQQDLENKGLAYHGKVSTGPFDLGRLFRAENVLGEMIMDMDVSGSGLDWNSLNMTMEGVLDSLSMLGENFNSIAVNGGFTGKRFNGRVGIDDELLSLDFDGEVDLREERPRFDFIADIHNARIDKLTDGSFDSPLWGNGLVIMNFTGSDIEKLEGMIEAEGVTLKDTSRTFSCRNFMISFLPDSLRYNAVRLRSDFVDADLEGSFLFGDLVRAVEYQIRRLLPSAAWAGDVPNPDTTQFAGIVVDIYETKDLVNIFMPDLRIEPGTQLKAGINRNGNIADLELNSPGISMNGLISSGVKAEGVVLEDQVRFSLNFDSFNISDSIRLKDLAVLTKVRQDSLGILARWKTGNEDTLMAGMLRGRAALPDTGVLSLTIDQSEIPVSKEIWAFNPEHRIIFDSAGITFRDVKLSTTGSLLRLNGRADKEPSSQLGLQFNNFQLGLANIFLEQFGIRLDGTVNGDLNLMAALGRPRGYSVLNIKDFTFNQDLLGDASINAAWEPDLRRLRTDARIIYEGNAGINYPLEITGFIHPERDSANFDLDIGLSNLKLATFQPYLTSLTSSMSGFISGELSLNGTFKDPELQGRLTARRAAIKFDYLNEEYSFTHDIEVSPGAFEVDGLVLNDARGNQAVCKGGIYHNGFRDLRMDLEIRPENFSVLNTTLSDNELFYGRAFTSGIARISGPLDDLLIEINARTESGTRMTIPISYDAEIAERGFITFVDKDADTLEAWEESLDLSGIRLDFELDATPEAEVMIDLPAQMGSIRGSGSGDIRFIIDTRGAFNMFGDYSISSGYYDMTLQNLLNRRFEIRKGGSISWEGDPYDAQISMTAVYRVRAGLSELRPFGDSSELYNQRIPVNCIIRLSDRLVNPTIDFAFELPESSEEINRIVYSRIDTTNDALVSRQMISLLVLKSFISDETGVNLASGVSSSSFELLSRQLSNWLSQISKDFDIGVNYRPGDEMTNEELELALSTQLFNERVLIDGNLGLAGDKNTQAASNLVGDVVVEVKLTDDGRFRVKAFNKSNYVDLIDNKAPYTQGVGIFYRKEFDKLGELFQRQKRPE